MNFPKIMERMRKIRSEISDFEAAERLAKNGIDVFMGHAVFDSPNSVMIGDRRVTFKKCVVCSGASAYIPPFPGLTTVPYLTNENLFNLTTLPFSMVVLGGGPIGCEMAQAFARFGTKVTVIDRSDVIMKKEDPDAALLVEESMKRDNVEFIHHAAVKGIKLLSDTGEKRVEISIRVKGESKDTEIVAQYVFVATGRRPRVLNMGLDQAGVKYSENTGIEVNDNMRTSNSNIFAAGDCCSRYQFTHMADWMARICIKNSLFYGSDRFSKLIIPWCTFTSPEISHVGLYDADLVEKKIPYDTLIRHFSDNDRALCESDSVGFIKVHVKKGSDHILGATIVGVSAVCIYMLCVYYVPYHLYNHVHMYRRVLGI